MEAVLQQRRPSKDQFLTLREKVMGVYGTLFDLSPAGTVTWRPSTVQGCIPERSNTTTPIYFNGDAAVALDLRRAILLAERNLISRILGVVGLSMPDLAGPQTRLPTTDELSLPIGKTSPDNAHLEVALTCLRSCNNNEDGLISYSRAFLFRHLEAVAGSLSSIDKSHKEQLGPLLHNLFRHDEAIDCMFWFSGRMSLDRWNLRTGRELDEVRRRWLYTPDGVMLLEKLFQDRDLASQIEDDVFQLFLKDEAVDRGRQRVKLLARVTERIARNVFLERSLSSRAHNTAVRFLTGVPISPSPRKNFSWRPLLSRLTVGPLK
ncbi:uncharacterized protein B0H64DRAFT_145190 [Chaetomium fimeti]|uniref:Uncharacterized protein n=1 Tax=Chaetomium fimeti TaxID=1854472 RepID=A0AAE0HF33_9PEZI|nr:hypothetical protein B0H64DRAFT_145190 [Chaetomium fimeti]